MSRRVEYQPAEAIDANLELTEILANFYVKWPEKAKERPELAGDRLVFDKTTGLCQSIGIVDYGKLQKR